uniref:Large ribosomal subunit protein uL30-like ferredoxin-like fold domain-containing protein n=1 Tax=Compsopogon caeruleus TaxID=31354 RepID=A0A7S1T9F7_9RHOD|mmetsp:Transcript_13191/g.26779  ORF Transcript_13191/g.26779 Transcript_13191/m.26779 type:complete len:165 (+) Transcript_13191:166-660(+)
MIEEKRAAQMEGKFFVPQGAKVVFVVRIRGINGVEPKVRKISRPLRLRQIHNGVFVKVNYATMRMIQRVEPLVAYGYPNLKSVRELIYKRGFGKVGKRGSWDRFPFSDNRIVEESLGNFGITCMGDLIHDLWTQLQRNQQLLMTFQALVAKGRFLPKVEAEALL